MSPAVSPKQYRFMQWARQNPSGSGVAPKVSNDFIHATPRSKRKKWAKMARKVLGG
jgi:hypothetical protein